MATVGIMGVGQNNQDQVKALKASLTADYTKPVNFVEGVAQDLLGVDVLIAAGGSRSALAAKAARGKSDKPVIVFTSVASYVLDEIAGQPNITGVCALTSDRDGDRLTWLLKMPLKGNRIGVLRNSNRGDGSNQMKHVTDAAGGKPIHVEDLNGPTTIHGAFNKFAGHIDGLVVTADPFFNENSQEVVDRANSHRIPTIYQWCEFVQKGGLMSWGPSLSEMYKRAGKMAASILNSTANPPKIPQPYTAQASEFELCVNQATATKLGVWPLPAPIAAGNPKIY